MITFEEAVLDAGYLPAPASGGRAFAENVFPMDQDYHYYRYYYRYHSYYHYYHDYNCNYNCSPGFRWTRDYSNGGVMKWVKTSMLIPFVRRKIHCMLCGELRRLAETDVFPRKMTKQYCGDLRIFAETTNPRKNCADKTRRAIAHAPARGRTEASSLVVNICRPPEEIPRPPAQTPAASVPPGLSDPPPSRCGGGRSDGHGLALACLPWGNLSEFDSRLSLACAT